MQLRHIGGNMNPKENNGPICWRHLTLSWEKREGSLGNPSFPHSLSFPLVFSSFFLFFPLSFFFLYVFNLLLRYVPSRRWAPWPSAMFLWIELGFSFRWVFTHSFISFVLLLFSFAPPSCLLRIIAIVVVPSLSPWRPRTVGSWINGVEDGAPPSVLVHPFIVSFGG